MSRMPPPRAPRFPAMRLSPRRFSSQQVREVTAFSLYLFLISIAIHVGTNIDNLIIGAYLGTTAIAVYTVAVRLAEYQRQLCGQFSGFLFPLVVRFDASRDDEALHATLLDGSRIALGLVGGVTLCLIAFGRPGCQPLDGTGIRREHRAALRAGTRGRRHGWSRASRQRSCWQRAAIGWSPPPRCWTFFSTSG